jgi:glycosyltransferase involved in cell wall biosynthesis
MPSIIEISIIVPLYNEEDSVTPLYEAIVSAVEPLDMEFEMLFVDDGSPDTTFSVAKQLAEKDKRLKVVKFRKNYGQTPAMAAGIDNAKGKILVTMDGDLQNDPLDIPLFIEKINEGYDIVVGWRHKRKDKLITRKIPSVIANWLIGKVTGVPIKDNGCSLKAYRSEVIQSVPLYSEMHRFIPAMTSLTGSRVAEIKVRHHARKFGESKYGLSRIYKVLLDLLTIKTIVSFSAKPLHWFMAISLPFLAISLIALLFALYDMIVSPDKSYIVVFGLAALLGSLTFFVILTGALGELIFKFGDVNLNKLSSLTRTVIPAKSSSSTTSSSTSKKSN